MTNTDIQLQIANPPVEPTLGDDDPSKRVIVGNLHRGGNHFPAEACLGLNRTTIVWEIDQIGRYILQIDKMKIDNAEGLHPDEIDLLELWSTDGLQWLLG